MKWLCEEEFVHECTATEREYACEKEVSQTQRRKTHRKKSEWEREWTQRTRKKNEINQIYIFTSKWKHIEGWTVLKWIAWKELDIYSERTLRRTHTPKKKKRKYRGNRGDNFCFFFVLSCYYLYLCVLRVRITACSSPFHYLWCTARAQDQIV